MKVTRNERQDGLLDINIEFDLDEPQRSTFLTVDNKGQVFDETGTQLSVKEIDRFGEEVERFIRECAELQELRAQALRNAVIEDLKASIAQGDETTLEEILTFVPHQNLVGALPEERWNDFSLAKFNQTHK